MRTVGEWIFLMWLFFSSFRLKLNLIVIVRMERYGKNLSKIKHLLVFSCFYWRMHSGSPLGWKCFFIIHDEAGSIIIKYLSITVHFLTFFCFFFVFFYSSSKIILQFDSYLTISQLFDHFFLQFFDSYLTVTSQLFYSFFYSLCQLFESFWQPLTAFWQLFDSFLTVFRQFFWQFFDSFLIAYDSFLFSSDMI